MKKIVCGSCGTSYPYEVAKNMESCLVCGEVLWENSTDDKYNDELVEDFEHPDLYFYAIDSEDKYKNKDLRDVWCQCITCRTVNKISYNKFDIIKSEYLQLKKDLNITCKGCGKSFANPIVPKRPDGWRELNRWEIDLENIPKCPTCSSIKIRKISVTSKVASVAMWGVLSRKVYKQWHCDICGSEW